MNLGETALHRLIGDIYDTALDEGLWPQLLVQIADTLGADSAHLVCHEIRTNEFPLMIGARTDPRYLRLYAEYYSTCNPWTDPVIRLPQGAVVTSDMLVPRREMIKTEFYSDYLRPRGATELLGSMLIKSDALMSYLALYRGEAAGAFGEREQEFCRALEAHLRRALQISQRFKVLQSERAAIGEALDRSSMGTILMNGNGRVVFVNRAAAEIMTQGDGLTIRRGELLAATATQTMELQKLVSQSVRRANGSGPAVGGAMSLARPSMKRPLSVLAAPLSANHKVIDGQTRPAAVLFVSDPEKRPETPAGLLQSLYGLTAAEAVVAMSTIEGLTPQQTAEALGTGIETVRTQLKRVMDKTGTHRQAELVRLILSGPVQVRLK